jgi:hypothetical protein
VEESLAPTLLLVVEELSAAESADVLLEFEDDSFEAVLSAFETASFWSLS